MKKVNNKGFTLIESIISFAVITLATGMFILGFTNVASLMSNSTIIKNQTNQLYNQINTNTNVETSTGTITITADESININVDIQYVYNSDHTIRLSKFTTNNTLAWVPSSTNSSNNQTTGDTTISGGSDNTGTTGNTGNTTTPDGSEGGDEETENLTANFKIVKKIDGNFLSYYKQDWYLVDANYTINVKNALKSEAPESVVALDGSLTQYIQVAPSQTAINNILNNVEYSSQLGSECKVFWFAIENNGNETPTVYGVLYPASYQKVLINIYWNNGLYYIPITDNGITEEYQDKIWDCYINGVKYTKEQIINGNYIKEDTDVYFVYY